MPLDLQKYRPCLDDYDMTDAQKDEFIQALWTIMQSFADQAFGFTASQQISSLKPDKICTPESKMVNSGHQSNITENFANDNNCPDKTPSALKGAKHE